MVVHKRGDVYWFTIHWHGQRIRKSAKTSNKRAAESIEAAYRVKLAQGEVDIFEKKPVPTLAVAMKEFLAWSKQQHSAHPNTHKRYLTSSKPLIRFFGDSKLDAITPEMIEKYKTMRLQTKRAPTKKQLKSTSTRQQLKPATINRELACLKIVFNHFIKQDIIVKNPVSRTKFLAENNEQMRVLSTEEEQLYLSVASQPLYDVAVLMLQTGCRPEEIYRLCVENVNFEYEYLQISFGKTKAARRKIPLSKVAFEILERRVAKAKGTCLFPHQHDPNKPMLKVNNAHFGALNRCKLKFRLYDLRHTFATRAAMSGTDIVTLAALLGHSRVQMVLRYAHPVEEHKVTAIRRLESFNKGKEVKTL